MLTIPQIEPLRIERVFLEPARHDPQQGCDYAAKTQAWIDHRYGKLVETFSIAGVVIPPKPDDWKDIQKIYRNLQKQVEYIYQPKFYAIGVA